MSKPDFSSLKALYLNCTLKISPRKSHTKGLIDVSMNIMKSEGVTVNMVMIQMIGQNYIKILWMLIS